MYSPESDSLPSRSLRPPRRLRGAPRPCAIHRRRPSMRPRRLLLRLRYARGWFGSSRGSARPPAGSRRNPGRGAPDGAGCSLFLVIPAIQVVFGVGEWAGAAEDLSVVFLIHALHYLSLFPGSGVGRRRIVFLWQAEELAHHVDVVEAGLGGGDLPLLLGDAEVPCLACLADLVFEVPDDLFCLVLELLYAVLAEVYLGVEPGLPGPRGGLQLGDVYPRRLERPTHDAHRGGPWHLGREVPDDLGRSLDGESVCRRALQFARHGRADLLG